MKDIIDRLSLKIELRGNVYDEIIDTDYIVSRAFKKLEAIIQVSREIAKKSHKLIILKGQNAQEDLKKAFNKEKYDYKLENSITNEDSKIILNDKINNTTIKKVKLLTCLILLFLVILFIGLYVR